MQQTKKDVLTSWIQWRIKKNKNAIIVINGPTGSGKTYSALQIGYQVAELLGTSFSVEGNVGFSFEELLMKTKRKENQKPGTVFIFEEIGAVGGGANARQWQSKRNMNFNSFLQTCRSKNQIYIMTTPSFSYLDAASRKLVHMQCEMNGINFKKKKSYLKPYVLQVNPRSGKIYFKYLRVNSRGVKSAIKIYGCDYPPEDIVKPYEAEKLKFQDRLEKMFIGKEKKVPKQKQKRIDPLVVKLLTDEGLTQVDIAKRLNVTTMTIRKYQKELLNKNKTKKEQNPLENGVFEVIGTNAKAF